MPVWIVANLDHRDPGLQPGEQLRQAFVFASMVRNLEHIDLRQRQVESDVAFGIGRQQHVEVPVGGDEHDGRFVGIARRRRLARALRAQHA